MAQNDFIEYNYWEPLDNDTVAIYLQRYPDAQLVTTVSFASLAKLRDVDLHFFAAVDRGNKRVNVMAVRRKYGKRELVLLHRLLVDAPDGLHVYHEDKNGLNNRLDNLRIDVPGATLNPHLRFPSDKPLDDLPLVDDLRLTKYLAK